MILTVSIIIIEDMVHVVRLKSTVAIFVDSVPKRGDLCPNNVLELFQSRMWLVTEKGQRYFPSSIVIDNLKSTLFVSVCACQFDFIYFTLIDIIMIPLTLEHQVR